MEHKRELKRNQMRRYLDGRTAVPLQDADIEAFKAWAEVRDLISTRGKGIGTGNVADLVGQIAAAYRHAPDVLDACLTAILADIPSTPDH
jgi:hypothetical protein